MLDVEYTHFHLSNVPHRITTHTIVGPAVINLTPSHTTTPLPNTLPHPFQINSHLTQFASHLILIDINNWNE